MLSTKFTDIIIRCHWACLGVLVLTGLHLFTKEIFDGIQRKEVRSDRVFSRSGMQSLPFGPAGPTGGREYASRLPSAVYVSLYKVKTHQLVNVVYTFRTGSEKMIIHDICGLHAWNRPVLSPFTVRPITPADHAEATSTLARCFVHYPLSRIGVDQWEDYIRFSAFMLEHPLSMVAVERTTNRIVGVLLCEEGAPDLTPPPSHLLALEPAIAHVYALIDDLNARARDQGPGFLPGMPEPFARGAVLDLSMAGVLPEAGRSGLFSRLSMVALDLATHCGYRWAFSHCFSEYSARALQTDLGAQELAAPVHQPPPHRTMEQLPDDVLAECFCFLTPEELECSICRVCRRWLRVARSDPVWRGKVSPVLLPRNMPSEALSARTQYLRGFCDRPTDEKTGTSPYLLHGLVIDNPPCDERVTCFSPEDGSYDTDVVKRLLVDGQPTLYIGSSDPTGIFWFERVSQPIKFRAAAITERLLSGHGGDGTPSPHTGPTDSRKEDGAFHPERRPGTAPQLFEEDFLRSVGSVLQSGTYSVAYTVVRPIFIDNAHSPSASTSPHPADIQAAYAATTEGGPAAAPVAAIAEYRNRVQTMVSGLVVPMQPTRLDTDPAPTRPEDLAAEPQLNPLRAAVVAEYARRIRAGAVPTVLAVGHIDSREPCGNYATEETPRPMMRSDGHSNIVQYILDGHHKMRAAAMVGGAVGMLTFFPTAPPKPKPVPKPEPAPEEEAPRKEAATGSEDDEGEAGNAPALTAMDYRRMRVDAVMRNLCAVRPIGPSPLGRLAPAVRRRMDIVGFGLPHSLCLAYVITGEALGSTVLGTGPAISRKRTEIHLGLLMRLYGARPLVVDALPEPPALTAADVAAIRKTGAPAAPTTPAEDWWGLPAPGAAPEGNPQRWDSGRNEAAASNFYEAAGSAEPFGAEDPPANPFSLPEDFTGVPGRCREPRPAPVSDVPDPLPPRVALPCPRAGILFVFPRPATWPAAAQLGMNLHDLCCSPGGAVLAERARQAAARVAPGFCCAQAPSSESPAPFVPPAPLAHSPLGFPADPEEPLPVYPALLNLSAGVFQLGTKQRCLQFHGAHFSQSAPYGARWPEALWSNIRSYNGHRGFRYPQPPPPCAPLYPACLRGRSPEEMGATASALYADAAAVWQRSQDPAAPFFLHGPAAPPVIDPSSSLPDLVEPHPLPYRRRRAAPEEFTCACCNRKLPSDVWLCRVCICTPCRALCPACYELHRQGVDWAAPDGQLRAGCDLGHCYVLHQAGDGNEGTKSQCPWVRPVATTPGTD
ncbi:hypothetical protein PAPYR_9641 [Paratrimastix pyriformis]|uniref:F-box domain-containing protein n=1 Tax=Paratrimastix pyriformis TaxID=342808 RepID=A0ABQ8UDJ6_9EUKA|nr:hypothetical protein PAPYR_9641 [Paratrimastix pyriformis]